MTRFVGFKQIILAAVSTVSISLTPPVMRADVGGGSGKPITPYSSGDKPKLEVVELIRRKSSEARLPSSLQTKDGKSLDGVPAIGLMYITNGTPGADPIFAFKGRTDDGKEVTISFSDVRTFWLERIDRSETALFTIVQFPAITPAALLEKAPTYTDLVDDYTKTVTLHIPLQAAGKELFFVRRGSAGDYRLVTAVKALKTRSEVKLDYGEIKLNDKAVPAIWWAVPSVTADPDYPYRHVFKR